MIIIEDAKGILNLNHMAIYLMLTAEERKQYGEKLKGLNNHKSLSRGIFHLEIVEKGDTPYENLPADMTRGAAKNCNVLVRLINSIHDTFCYGLDYIDLTQEEEIVRDNLKVIVDDICQKNITQLEILVTRNTSTSILAMQKYRDSKIVAEVFEKALERKYIKKEECPILQLQKVSATTDLAESLAIAKDAFTSPQSEKIERELCERNAPEKKPTISMSIKNISVPNGYYKSGKQKKAFGLELVINGDIVNIPITNTDWKVLYLAVVAAKLESRRLRRKNFTYDNNDKEAKEWLERKFSSLSLNKKFDDWFLTINSNGPASRINDSKSKINKHLWKYLSPKYKDAYHYVFIENIDQRTPNSFYTIHLNKAHIHIADYIINI